MKDEEGNTKRMFPLCNQCAMESNFVIKFMQSHRGREVCEGDLDHARNLLCHGKRLHFENVYRGVELPLENRFMFQEIHRHVF